MTALAVLHCASLAGLAWLYATAPEGFETPGIGFRYGKPEDYE